MTEAEKKAIVFFEKWDSGQLFFEVKTSGSTGAPKVISLSRKAMEYSARVTGTALGVQPSDVIHCCLPVDKAGGFMQLVRSRVWDIPVHVSEPEKNPLQNGTRGTIISLTPMQLSAILQNKISADALNLYRIVLVGGGDIHNETEKLTAGFSPDFYHTYGMTETCSHIALRKFNTEKSFQPLPGIQVGTDAAGCLTVCGDVTGGITLHTRDEVVFKDGGFVVLGRSDFVINSGGVKIHPETIEKIISEANGIPDNSIMITGKKDAEYGEIPVLFVNLSMAGTDLKTDLNYPEKYARPKMIYGLENFIYTDTGKINRRETREWFSRISRVPL